MTFYSSKCLVFNAESIYGFPGPEKGLFFKKEKKKKKYSILFKAPSSILMINIKVI